jgi:hypothetical protein
MAQFKSSGYQLGGQGTARPRLNIQILLGKTYMADGSCSGMSKPAF